MFKSLDLSPKEFIAKLKVLEANYDDVLWLTSGLNSYIKDGLNDSLINYSEFDSVIGLGCVKRFELNQNEDVKDFFNSIEQSKQYLLGYLSYELKNVFEHVRSKKTDEMKLGLSVFIQPEVLIKISNDNIQFLAYNQEVEKEFIKLLNSNNEFQLSVKENHKVSINLTFDEYIKKVNKIKQHIARGDIYEVNFCVQFFIDNYSNNLFDLFVDLLSVSPNPFSGFVKSDGKYILSASPERFLKRKNNKLIAQPIKGTAPRALSLEQDNTLKNSLLLSPKEISENVMIVDLVRNDLSRIAKKGTVKVEELFGLYTFPQVHQMISTISCEIDAKTSIYQILKANFPMGSMTGAPKIRAMELIDEFEEFNRGVFSGSIGYVSPEGDFDFSVVIRSIIYNSKSKRLVFPVGSAITHKADAKAEYEECYLKAKAILKVLNQ